MSDEYPEQVTHSEGQDLYSERTAAGAPPTGDARVDQAVAGLNRLAGTPADEHVAILEEVHGQLRDILGELDETPESPQGPGQS
jgi:hypothetical protein